MEKSNSLHLTLARKIVEQFKIVACVEAITLGGSNTVGSIDKYSDIDLYIFAREVIPLNTRRAIVNKLGASKTDLNLTFWDLGDEWFDLGTGIEVDIMYWDPAWIEGQLERVLGSHQASLGYTTSFWHTILNSKMLFDRSGWFASLQERCKQPYPEQLKHAIIAKNHPMLRSVIPSYYRQIKKALGRGDFISVNHRIAALLASYFDVIFAINEIPNPGEKRNLEFVLERCSITPPTLKDQIEIILQSAGTGSEELLIHMDELLNDLDALLLGEGFDPENSRSLSR